MGRWSTATCFYQQTFIEAMGATIAIAAPANATRGQGDASNLQRFKAHHPPTFTGGGDPMVANHWFRQIEDSPGYGDHLGYYSDYAGFIPA